MASYCLNVIHKFDYVVCFHKNALWTPHLHDFDNLRTFSTNLLGMKTVTANLFAFSMYAKQGRLLGTLTASLNINFTLFYTFPMFLLSKIGGYPSPQAKKVQLFLKFFAKKASPRKLFLYIFFFKFWKYLLHKYKYTGEKAGVHFCWLERWAGFCIGLLPVAAVPLYAWAWSLIVSCR